MATNLRILRFWTKYVQRNGVNTPVDMVEYCAPGMAQRQTTPAPISMLSKLHPDADIESPAYLMARDRWEAIRPAYEAWKAGNEVPTNGTPLGAWPGISPEQADVLRAAGMRSVEEIAESSDSVLGRIQLPGIRDLAAQAKLFLGSRDQAKVAASLAEKDRQIEEMRDQLEEMRQMILESAAREPDLMPDGSEAPRRRGPGRPRKEDEAAA